MPVDPENPKLLAYLTLASSTITLDQNTCASSLWVVIAPRSPWHNPYVERLIGSMRRELLDHIIVLNALHLRPLLQTYVDYYHRFRTHRALDMDAPFSRPARPPALGPVREVPEVGGLHHHYERIAV